MIMGTFPGAVKSSGLNEILGDVFEVTDPESVFRVLDHTRGTGK